MPTHQPGAKNQNSPRTSKGQPSDRTPGKSDPSGKPPPGLDEARHRAAQRTAQQADVLRDGVFPALMTSAVNLSQFSDPHAFQIFLDRLKAEAGNPQSPIAQMLIEQVGLAHLRIAQLHVSAAHAKDIEAVKVYTASAARLLGEFRRSALALEEMISPSTGGKAKAKLRVVTRAS